MVLKILNTVHKLVCLVVNSARDIPPPFSLSQSQCILRVFPSGWEWSSLGSAQPLNASLALGRLRLPLASGTAKGNAWGNWSNGYSTPGSAHLGSLAILQSTSSWQFRGGGRGPLKIRSTHWGSRLLRDKAGPF